jgi:Ca2+-binding RTX toxin-like protein
VATTLQGVTGGAGGDLIAGGSGADTIDGGEGADSGADTIDGGEGADILTGGSGDDTITGGAGGDLIAGGSGADTIDGGEGADVIFGGSGDDTLTGGTGADHFAFAPGDGNDTITDFNTSEDTINLFLFGGDLTFADLTITATTDGTGSIITVPGEDGQNNGITITLEGVASTDVTADMFEFSNKTPEFSGPDVIPLLGDEGADNLVGTESTNYISGGEGDDTITVTGAVINYAHGGEGDDQITGGAGFMDILVGGEGDDTLDGGAGINHLHGGEGDDTFVIQAGQTSTTIYDFTDGDDQIDLSNISGITGFDDLTITADGDDVVINLSSHGAGSLRLENVAVSDLDADDFVFAASTTVVDDGM